MYSTEYLIEPKEETVCFVGDNTDFESNTNLDVRMEVAEGVEKVLDCFCVPAPTYANGIIQSNFHVCILYENVLGEAKSKTSVYNAKCEIPSLPLCCSVSCLVDNFNLLTDSAGVNISFTANFKAKRITDTYIKHICDLKADKTLKRQFSKKGNLILKVLNSDESIWDIAKYYGTTEAAVLAANNAADESELECGRFIMIPAVR